MAKNNDKRAERMARSNRNVNRAITVLMAGVIAEFYLLMVNNYYVKGGVGQVLTMMTVLQVIDYIGCALFGAGLVVWLMRKKWTRFAPAAPWLLCIGFFFAVSSILMLKVYPSSFTLCSPCARWPSWRRSPSAASPTTASGCWRLAHSSSRCTTR
mgnify:CR=1 FL=1